MLRLWVGMARSRALGMMRQHDAGSSSYALDYNSSGACLASTNWDAV